MIKKLVRKYKLSRLTEVKNNLAYWLSRPPQERIQAVEILRTQFYGRSVRLRRVARVIQRSQS